jgi:hypothetical protein
MHPVLRFWGVKTQTTAATMGVFDLYRFGL